MGLIKTRQIILSMGLLEVLFLLVLIQTGVAPYPAKLWILMVYCIAACVLVMLLPARAFAWLTLVKESVLQNTRYLVMLFALIFIGGVIYALNLRLVFDEGGIVRASRALTDLGILEFFVWYKNIPWLGMNHPPLIPLIYGLAMDVFGPYLLVLRVISLIFMVGTLVCTYLVGRELYDRATGLVAVLILPSFSYIFRLGAAASNDIPLTFFFTLTLWLMLRQFRAPTYWLAVVMGISLGLGSLTKYTMLLILPVLVCWAFIMRFPSSLYRYLAISVVISMTICALWLVVAFQIGVLSVQVERLSGYADTVLSSAKGVRLMLEWVVARLPSAISPYNLPLIFLGGWKMIWQQSRSNQLLLIWVILVFMSLVLTMPDTRYFLPIFPALAIISARSLSTLGHSERIIGLIWLYWIGTLYLFVDWYRTVPIFR